MCADGLDRSPDPNDVVRQKALELDRAARQSRVFGFALNLVVAAMIVAAVGAVAWNSYRIRELTSLIEQNQRVIEEYNAGHGKASHESHQNMIELLICVTDAFARQADVRACYRPATPPPSDPTLPSENKEQRR